MESIAPVTPGISEVLFPLLSLGTLLTALITFGSLAMHRRDAHVYWSVFALLCVSILVSGFDTSVLVVGGLFGRTAIALQLSRLHELATTAFAVALPYALWAVLPVGSRLRTGARCLLVLGITLTAAVSVIAFAAPGHFVSVTTQVERYIAYSSTVGRGHKGALFSVRDATLGFIVLACLVVSIVGIARRLITGTNRLLVAGIVLGTLIGSSAIYANFFGTYPGLLADLHFSRVSLAIALFALLATVTYVLRYVRQSRALDEAIRELQHRRNRLAFLAYHNDVTQMPNKQALIRDIDALFTSRETANDAAHRPFAEAFICDLDSFGSLEDSYGFRFSAALLQRVGQRIFAHVASDGAWTGTVYHIEGDRFALLIPRPLSLSDRIRLEQALVREISTPLRIEEHDVFLSAGIGHYSLAPDARNAEEVLRRLKRGLAAAAETNTRVGRYSPGMAAKFEASQELVQELRRAIRQEEFHVYYQPIVDRDGEVSSCEALIRWDRADTERFISLAEQSGLIVPITEFVIRTVCGDLARFRESLPGIRVNINISARHITQIGFPSVLQTAVARNGLHPGAIGVEITETSFLHEDTEVTAILAALTTAGFSVAIDDFGTGYSSMSYLKRIPATTLKIDRSFIRELPHRMEDRALVDAMISLAHNLGKQVLAEGVETVEQVSYLLGAGIDSLQGYHYARPVPRERFVETVAAVGAAATPRELRP